MLAGGLSWIDVAVLAAYVLGSRLAFGWWASRRACGGGAEGYFLAGRSLGWPMIGLSFYVSNMSGSTFVALPASGYAQGIAVYHYEWLPALILILFAFVLLPAFFRARVATTPEFLEKRYDRRAKLAFSVFLLLANILIDAAAALYAGAIVLEALLPGVPFWAFVLSACLLAGVYIVAGGLRAVVLNDVLQAVVILLGGVLLATLTWQAVPSWQAVTEAAPEALHLIRPADDPVMPWPGVLTGVLIVGIYFWGMNQFMIQRALGARSLDHARWGALFAGVLKLPNLFILILPGTMALTLYPELSTPDLVFPTLVVDLLPVGLRGVMLAALLAAILSSLEAILNSASTLFTLDLVRHFRPDLGDARMVRIGRIATLAFMLLAAAWAPVIEDFPTLWQYLQSILSYVTPPVVVVFLAGIFWRRASATAAFVTLTGGVLLGAAGWVANEIIGVVEIQYLYACGILFALNALLLLAVSLATERPDAQAVRTLVWTRARWREEQVAMAEGPRLADPRLLALALTLLALGIVVVWR